MTIYTLHEAEQRAELRKALRWPTYPNCSGSCQQDRACDCTAAVEEEDTELTQFGAFNALPAVALGLVALAALAALVLAAVRMTL